LKLKCFYCSRLFKKKNEIFRNELNYPLCEDCFKGLIDDDWRDDGIDNVINDVKNKFNGKYNNFLKDLHKKCDICEDCNTWYLKDCLIEIDGKMYCEGCLEDKDKKELIKKWK